MAGAAKIANLNPAYKTPLGRMFNGMCEEVLCSPSVRRHWGKIQLVFTSPPFALNRKKKYGNIGHDQYVDWLAGFAPLFRELLTPDGSLVVELGNAWVPGEPTMSTLSIKALLAFQERADLHLCQEFICFNPARLPTPAQWVTIERIRVKDAFTRVWWMSPTPRPKADNRRVATRYSRSMEQLLKRGTYNAGRRPSQHMIGAESFLTHNGGAIPPNVLISPRESASFDLFEVLPIANTGAKDPYQAYCREHGLDTHPARMPEKLVEFFVEFLTETGDRVVDPFAGSNTTGAVAERLGRKWLAIEANPDYVRGSRARFSRFAGHLSRVGGTRKRLRS
jgi:DNA modification methylase